MGCWIAAVRAKIRTDYLLMRQRRWALRITPLTSNAGLDLNR